MSLCCNGTETSSLRPHRLQLSLNGFPNAVRKQYYETNAYTVSLIRPWDGTGFDSPKRLLITYYVQALCCGGQVLRPCPYHNGT